jgi:hypothetical protein
VTSPQSVTSPFDFENDIRRAVLLRLEHDPADDTALQVMSPADLLVLWLNWHSRFIPLRPREVSISWEFAANALRWDPTYRPALDHILDALKTGGDVNPHLSEDVLIGYEGSVRRAKRKRPDLDLLLNDWNVHHLHLSLAPYRKGLFERTGPLLFVMVGREQASILDIFPHGSFSRDRIAHIMIDNWPKANFVHLKGDVLSGPIVSEAERDARRKAGIHSGLVDHRGKWYFIALGGLTSASTNIQHSRLANVVMRGLRQLEEHAPEYLDWVTETLRLNNVPVPSALDLRFIIRNDGWFAIREEMTQVLFEIPGLPKDPG